MTTARDLIEDAAAEFGEFAQDTPLSDTDAQLMLRRLQRMLDSWATERLMVYALVQESFAMVAGTSSYTTASLAAGRPVAIESVFVRNDSTDWDVALVPEAEYDAIPNKTTTGLPEVCFYDPGFPTGTLYFWPSPVVAYTAYVSSRRVLTGTLALSTSIALPPGYERAIVTNLAVECAPSFGGQVSQSTVEMARQSKANIKTLNYVPGELSIDFNVSRARSNIIAGV